MKSKKDLLQELFFNQSKSWHFEELRKKVHIGKPQLARWLLIFEKEGVIKRIKNYKKMPYYLPDFNNPSFKNQKRLFARKKLFDSGLLDHLSSLSKAKVVIFFGSFSRSDWYEKSDIDIFIYGDDKELNQSKYELKLKRDIQIHRAENKQDIKRIERLLPYILSGEFIKGSIQDLGVEIHAKT